MEATKLKSCHVDSDCGATGYCCLGINPVGGGSSETGFCVWAEAACCPPPYNYPSAGMEYCNIGEVCDTSNAPVNRCKEYKPVNCTDNNDCISYGKNCCCSDLGEQEATYSCSATPCNCCPVDGSFGNCLPGQSCDCISGILCC